MSALPPIEEAVTEEVGHLTRAVRRLERLMGTDPDITTWLEHACLHIQLAAADLRAAARTGIKR